LKKDQPSQGEKLRNGPTNQLVTEGITAEFYVRELSLDLDDLK